MAHLRFSTSGNGGVPEFDPDTATIDGIIGALYEAMSFDPGQEPDWDRLRELFLPGGTLIPPRGPRSRRLRVLTLERFIKRAQEQIELDTVLQTKGFRECEIARRIERFSHFAHVLSTYEGRFSEDHEPIARGINSIQLHEDKGRWWVVSIMWADEAKDVPIPRKYLRTRK